MKKLFFILSIAITGIFITGCDHTTITTGDDSSGKIEGNGKLTTQSRTVSTFHAVLITGVFHVQLEQGAQEAVKVEADENIQPLILCVVENDTLKIKLKEHVAISNAKKINISVTVVDINKLDMQGVGTLKCASVLRLKELEFKNEGVGATSLNVEVGKLTVNTESLGALTLTGMADDVTITQNGVGLLQAFELKANKLTLTTSGVGASEVYAANEINIDASGIGSVKYKGGAAKRKIKSEGVSKVTEME